MQVAHLTSVHPRYDTRIFLKECASLAKAGYQVVLVVADGKGSETAPNGVNILDTGKAPAGRLLRILLTPWKIMWAAKRIRPAIVHCHDPELIPAALFLRLFGCHVIFDMHENVPKQILNKHWIPQPARKALSVIYSVFERLTLNRFTIVFAEHSYADDYPWIIQKTTILNMPDIDLMPTVSGAGKFPDFTVGYIGGGTEERGVVTTANAIQMLRDEGADIRFVCIGPLNRAVTENATFKMGIAAGWIDAPGRMNGMEGWEIISRCHVGVAVLQPIQNYIDSWPTKMFEYMAMGLPVIVSDFPLYRVVVEASDCGICVDPLDPEAIAGAIGYLSANSDKAWHMGENGIAAVAQHYQWGHEKQKLLRLYMDIARVTN